MMAEQPRWRADFPVRWDEDNYMTRRELAKFLTLGSGLLASVNVLIAVIGLRGEPRTPPVQRIAAADDIAPGSSLLFRYPTPDEPASWCATARADSTRSHRSARTCRAPSCIARRSGRWRARATRDHFP